MNERNRRTRYTSGHIGHIVLFSCCCLLLLASTRTLAAQRSPSRPATLPDSPVPAGGTPVGSQANVGDPQNPDSQVSMMPSLASRRAQTAWQKFSAATENSFSYPSVVFAAAQAGIYQAQNSFPEFHQGDAAYGRYFWHSFADQTAAAYSTEFILPALLHQDSRYYRLRQGGFWKRSAYAFSRSVITRSDNGNEQFNTSEILGSGIAAAASSAYYPSRDRTFSIVSQRWATNLTGDAFGFFLKEFSPEVGHALGNVVPFRRRNKQAF